MARAIRWTVPFVSFNGTSCHVDIYDEGWTGSVTTLTGAANPFEYEENNDEDLLNGVIRYRTGYLRVIEQNHGDLSDVYPQVNTDRYIEFYYGSTLDFNGFIQAQEFENGWEPGPRVLEFPVISPLGLADGILFDYRNYNRPGWLTIHNLLRDSFGLLQGNYEGYCFPQYLTHSSSLTRVTNSLWINSLTFCPFGNTYDKNNSLNLDGIYDPKSVGYALANICTAFGVILHDVPGTPIFQRVDYQGDYFTITLNGTSPVRITPQTTNITSIASIASDDNVESVVMPLSKIEVTYEGSDNIPQMTFNRCLGYRRGCAVEGAFCSNMPKIDDLQGDFSYAVGIDSNGHLTPEGKICLGAYGVESLSERIIWQPGGSRWTDNMALGSYTFFEWYGDHRQLRFKFNFGYGINNMSHEGTYIYTIAVLIKTGNYYWNGTSWEQIPSSQVYSKQWSDGTEDCEVSFDGAYPAMSPEPLEVIFYAVQNVLTSFIYMISDVKLMKWSSPAYEYLDKNKYEKSFVIKGSASPNEGSVTCGYGITAHTMNQFRYNTNVVVGTDEVDLVNNQPKYPYLLTAQDRLQLDMKMTYQTPLTLYLNRFTLWGSNKKWCTIARTFRPWDDVHRFTFHHSTIFDY